MGTSTDGVKWTFGGVAEDQLFIDVASGNGKILAITVLGRIYTTTDGLSWEWQQWPDTFATWVMFSSGRFIVHSLSLTGGFELRYSVDGKGWTPLFSSREPRFTEVPAVGSHMGEGR